MASMAEQGLATESLELPSNVTENSALLTDVSIADQSAALAQMKEDNKETMKQVAKNEQEKKKKAEEAAKKNKVRKQKEAEKDAKEKEFEKEIDPELVYFLNNNKNSDGLLDKLLK